MFQPIRQAFDHFQRNYTKHTTGADEESRFRSFTISCAVGVPLMIAFGFYSLFTTRITLSLAIFTSTIGLVGGWFFLYRGIAAPWVYRINGLLFSLLLLYMMYIGGFDGSKALWCYIFPLLAYFLLGSLEGTVWICAFLFCFQLILWNPFNLSGAHDYPPDFSIRLSLSFICITVITYFYEKFRFTYRTQIERQNKLLNIEIIERQKVETALRISENKYKAIYQQAAEGIIIIDAKGAILEANPQMNLMLHYPTGALTGVDVHDLIHPEDLKITPSQIPEIIDGQTVFLDRRMRTAEGDYLLFERSGRLVEENRILLLYRDITDRRAAEIALEKANKELDRLANLDGLTQIANRRKFETTLKIEWQRLSREQLPMTIILGDIDFFKQFNDLYGHQEGDSCLITIAQTLEHMLHRSGDLVARFGGEEFIILLPNTHSDGGQQIAEEIRKAVLGLRILHKNSKCSLYVTMSLGVSTIVPNRETLPEDLVAIADKALYIAKKTGRNRVEVGNVDFLG